MKLNEWLKQQKISNTEFADLIGVHVSFITHINKGRRNVSPTTALKIEKVTGGSVTVLELLYPENSEKEKFKA